MRFLCLHGMGTSSDIFAAQLGMLVTDLERLGHEFVFMDGLHECDTSDSVAAVFPEPYLCYYPLPTPELVRAAHDQVHEILEDEGPIDGVIAFSQGAALAASMLLQQAKDSPHEDLFGIAIFIAASLPFDLDDEAGADVWRSTQDTANSLIASDADPLSRKRLSGVKTVGTALPGEFCGELGFDKAPGVPDDPYNFSGQLLTRYHPSRTPPDVAIRVPSLHVFGSEDPYLGQARLLAGLCDKETRSTLAHTEGHCVPRNAAFRHTLVNLISNMADRASFHRH